MLESASDLRLHSKLGIARSEGILLRYLAEAYRSLDRTVPIEKRDECLRDIIRGSACGYARSTRAW